jgi:hypothetical protein
MKIAPIEVEILFLPSKKIKKKKKIETESGKTGDLKKCCSASKNF